MNLSTCANTLKIFPFSAVLDEVDILFNDEDFEPVLQNLINSSPVTTQYLFVTATLPVGIYNKLVELFPDCGVIMGPGMHRISAGLEEVGFRSDLYKFVINSFYLERFPLRIAHTVDGQIHVTSIDNHV